MKPLKRQAVNKSKSAKRFGRSVKFTKAANLTPAVMRGGWRL